MRSHTILIAMVALLAAAPAVAHVTLEGKQAPVGSYYKAVFAVPHGCAGSATTKIRVQIPEGVIGVKPTPKAGWQLSTTMAKLAQPYVSEGQTITEGVKEVAWTGGKLLDAWYDEFMMQVTLPNTPGKDVFFPVVQECEKGVTRWIEIPEAGKNAGDYKNPAPRVSLTPKAN